MRRSRSSFDLTDAISSVKSPKGSLTIPLTFSLQACDETSCIRAQTLHLPVTITVGDVASAPDNSGLFNDFNPAVFSPSSRRSAYRSMFASWN